MAFYEYLTLTPACTEPDSSLLCSQQPHEPSKAHSGPVRGTLMPNRLKQHYIY